jgi:hypothetical protein
MSRFAVALSVLLALAGCAPRPATPELPPAAPPPTTGEGLGVALLWSVPVDLDLYLTDPTWETLYFANNPTRSGAKIERDTRCSTLPPAPPFVERASLEEPSAGPYRIGVHFIDACAADAGQVSFRLVVDFEGRRFERAGTIRRDEFRVIALEFEVREGESGRELFVGDSSDAP